MTTQPPGRRHDVRAVVVYTAARAGLFALCLALAWVAGLDGLLLLVVALLASGMLSWFLLQRQRLAVGEVVADSVDRARGRLRERTLAEDAYVDALHASRADADVERPAR